ncbi:MULTISPECIES: hypothetical protein [unclassified Mycolicibacterium]|uniref:hypothetical protein n=1 Tax=unclassified Mycolicibacterium TaxID=2636767 RepID=UPI0013916B33|nr:MULTISPECIES: hypothetical protein [unclassified Mycolicibacterium]
MYTTTGNPGGDPPPPDLTGVWIALLLVCASVILAGLGARAWRHRGLNFLKSHVTVASHPGAPVPFDVRPTDKSDRDHILAVVPSEVSRSTTVEEIRS